MKRNNELETKNTKQEHSGRERNKNEQRGTNRKERNKEEQIRKK
jgi:hypothetical protein